MLSFPAFAQDDEEGNGKELYYGPPEETPEQRHARMLGAFNEEDLVAGQVTFSFVETIDKKAAVKILQKYDLKLQHHKVCMEATGPGEPVQDLSCEITDSWNEMIKAATVDVPEGKEKAFADKLVTKEGNVLWAEPVYRMTLNTESKQLKEASKTQVKVEEMDTGWLEGISAKILSWFKGWFS